MDKTQSKLKEKTKKAQEKTILKEEIVKTSFSHMIISPELKFLFLYTYLKKFTDKKILVLFSTQEEVKYFSLILKAFQVPTSELLILDIIDNSSLIKKIYDIIIIYDNPEKTDIENLNSKGRKILLIFFENEKSLLEYYQLNSTLVSFPKNTLFNIQKKVEELVSKDFNLYDSSVLAYKSYIRNYAKSPLNKDKLRNADNLDLKKVCHQFGQSVPMFISIK